MNRLNLYLIRLFSRDALALLAVASVIMFMAQSLRVMDAGSLRGLGLPVLLTQALLSMPTVAVSFLFVCAAMGLARGLRTLQATRELHIIHMGQRLSALLGAIAIYTLIAAVMALLLAHIVAPATTRAANVIRAGIAADLVGRSLVPHRFAKVVEGVTITVGGRKPNGEITSFFADDERSPDVRRTYIADSALLTADERGYVLQLINGTIQYRTKEGRFSEISFNRYDIALERLTGAQDEEKHGGSYSSLSILADYMETGEWTRDMLKDLIGRTIEGLRVVALCLFVTAIAAFPSGRRKDPKLPIELTVLLVAFVERGISTYPPSSGLLAPATGCVALIAVSLVILILRMRALAPMPREAHS